MYKVRAKQCIVASGSFDQPVVFRNNDLPGVLLTSAVQRLVATVCGTARPKNGYFNR